MCYPRKTGKMLSFVTSDVFSNSGDTKNSQRNGPGFYFVQPVTKFSEVKIAEH